MLKEKFHQKSLELKKELIQIAKEHGDTIVAQVTLNQIFRGARGIPMMHWDVSSLDPIKGIRFRGYPLSELITLLPSIDGDSEPLPEGLFWLMMTGDIPTRAEINWLSEEWARRAEVPEHTYQVINVLPKTTHPMTQFSLSLIHI